MKKIWVNIDLIKSSHFMGEGSNAQKSTVFFQVLADIRR